MKRTLPNTSKLLDTRLDAVDISNFISIDTLKLEIEDKGVILVGPNGSGKSNIVRAVEEVFSPDLSQNLVIRNPQKPLEIRLTYTVTGSDAVQVSKFLKLYNYPLADSDSIAVTIGYKLEEETGALRYVILCKSKPLVFCNMDNTDMELTEELNLDKFLSKSRNVWKKANQSIMHEEKAKFLFNELDDAFRENGHLKYIWDGIMSFFDARTFVYSSWNYRAGPDNYKFRRNKILRSYKKEEPDNKLYKLERMLRKWKMGKHSVYGDSWRTFCNTFSTFFPDLQVDLCEDDSESDSIPFIEFSSKFASFTASTAPSGAMEMLCLLVGLVNPQYHVLVLDEPGVFFYPTLRQKFNEECFSSTRKLVRTTLMVTHSESYLSSSTLPYVRCVYSDADAMQATKVTGKPRLVYDKKELRPMFDRFACDPRVVPIYFTPKNQLVFLVEGEFDQRFLAALFSVYSIDATIIICGGKETIIHGINLAEFCKLEWRALYDYDAFKVKTKKDPVEWASWDESNRRTGQHVIQKLFKNLNIEWIGAKHSEQDTYNALLETKIGKFGRIYVWPNHGDLETATGKTKDYWKQQPFDELVETIQMFNSETSTTSTPTTTNTTTTTTTSTPTTTNTTTSTSTDMTTTTTTSAGSGASPVTSTITAFVDWVKCTQKSTK